MHDNRGAVLRAIRMPPPDVWGAPSLVKARPAQADDPEAMLREARYAKRYAKCASHAHSDRGELRSLVGAICATHIEERDCVGLRSGEVWVASKSGVCQHHTFTGSHIVAGHAGIWHQALAAIRIASIPWRWLRP